MRIRRLLAALAFTIAATGGVLATEATADTQGNTTWVADGVPGNTTWGTTDEAGSQDPAAPGNTTWGTPGSTDNTTWGTAAATPQDVISCC